MNKNIPIILLIDDKPWWSDIFEKVLSKHGYRVDIVSNEKGALKRLDEQKYDIVVLDFYVSGSDGISSLKRILEKHPDERIIVVSASPTWEEGREIFALGAIDYLSKPADESSILRLVETNLRKKLSLISTPVMPSRRRYYEKP